MKGPILNYCMLIRYRLGLVPWILVVLLGAVSPQHFERLVFVTMFVRMLRCLLKTYLPELKAFYTTPSLSYESTGDRKWTKDVISHVRHIHLPPCLRPTAIHQEFDPLG